MSVTIGREYTEFECAVCHQIISAEHGNDQTEKPVGKEELILFKVPVGSRICMNCMIEEVEREMD